MRRQIVLTDIDNTLYDWPAFFAPSFRAMVYALMRELRLTEDQIYAEFKEVFARRGSLEYSFLIQELRSVRGLETERIRHLIRTGRGAFRRVQHKRLQPYPGVRETLNWLFNQNAIVIAVTNSPIHRAQQRLWDLKLDNFLSGLVAWEGFEGYTNPVTAGFIHPSRQRTKTRVKKSIALPLSECKPNSKHYVIALEAFFGEPSDAWVIGNSVSTDLVPAAKLGIKTIWAKYGAGLDPEDRDENTLLKITHWGTSEINKMYDTSSVERGAFKPNYEIESIDKIREIIPATVLSLF